MDLIKFLSNNNCKIIKINDNIVEFECGCGQIYVKTKSAVRRAPHCKVCRYSKTANNLKLSFKIVKQFFKSQGCQLLEKSYKNAKTKMCYKCSCGAKSNIIFDSFKRGNRCKNCGIVKRVKTVLNDFKKRTNVVKFFEENGCVLLDPYIDSKSKLRYICKCGKHAITSWNAFRRYKKCLWCGIKNRSGEKHYEWKKDREAHYKNYLFRQRSYKLLQMTLKVTGRVKNKKTADLLGYSYKDLQKHITDHANYKKVKGGKWHIDHIFPIKAFVDFGIDDLKIINCLDNLRPITAEANLKKSACYNKCLFVKWLNKRGIFNFRKEEKQR